MLMVGLLLSLPAGQRLRSFSTITTEGFWNDATKMELLLKLFPHLGEAVPELVSAQNDMSIRGYTKQLEIMSRESEGVGTSDGLQSSSQGKDKDEGSYCLSLLPDSFHC